MIKLLTGALGLVGLSPAALALYGGIALAGVLALGGIVTGIYHAGYSSAARKCEAEALRAQLQAKQVDLDAATKAANDREQLLAEIDAARTEDQKRIADYEQRLKVNPACVLTDDDWRAVDGVRGNARRRSR